MTLAALGIGYLSVGVALAVALAIARSPSIGDLVMMIGLWPIAAPLGFAGDAGGAHHGERALVAALARAAASPLAAVLPDPETARVLASRLREAGVRLVELDRVLARPDFDLPAAEQRARELFARGATAAAATAELRVRTLGTLRALRARFHAELDEVRELIAQLVTQAELVRLEPAIAQRSGDLVRELVARVERLDDLFAFQATIDGPGAAPRRESDAR